jgi:dihydroflavonol-4-reductase
MPTLITGATGVIGSSVVRELLRDGQEVRALVRKTSDLRNLQGLKLELCEGDVLDRASLERAIQGCETLHHLAGVYAHWHPRGAEFIRRANVEGTRNVLEAAEQHRVARVIHTSSISAVGFHPDRPSTEADFPVEDEDMRRSPYRHSKVLSEQIAFAFARERGLNLTIVNPASPIGVRDWVPTPTGRTILDFLNGKMPAYVEVGINLIDVEDLALGFLLAQKKGRPGERYILGNHNTTLAGLFKLISEETGLKPPKVKLPAWLIRVLAEIAEPIADRTKRPPVAAIEQALHLKYNEYADCRKARQELGLPQNDIRIAIRKAVDYYLKEGLVLPQRARLLKRAGA